jgi:O-antigen/teichoic acid export membrane protein
MLAAQTLASGLIFLQGIVLARALPRDDFATIQQVMLLVMLATPLLGQTFAGTSYFLPRYPPDRQKAFLFQSIVFNAALGGLVAAGLLAAAPAVGTLFANHQLPGALAVFCLFPILYLPSFCLGQMLICNQRIRAAAAVQVALAAAETVLVVSPVLAGWPLIWFFRARLVAAAIAFALTAICTAVLYRHARARWDPSMLSDQLRYCLPTVFAGALSSLSRDLDRVLVSTFFPPATMAVYSVGARQLPLIPVVRKAIAKVTLPVMVHHLAAGQPQPALWLWKQIIQRHLMIFLPPGVFALFFAEPIMLVLYGPKYAASALFFQIYLTTLLWHCLAGEHALQAIGRTRVLTLTSLLIVAINLPFSALTARAGWLAGPAVGTVVALAVAMTVNAVVAARSLRLRLRQLLPFGLALRLTLVSAVAIAPAALLASCFQWRVASLFVAGLAYAATWLAIAAALGWVPWRAWLAAYFPALHARTAPGGP